MRSFILAALFAPLLLLASCPGKEQRKASQTPVQPPANALHVALLRTDLGLYDGQMVLAADAVLTALNKAGQIRYSPVGTAPAPLAQEAGQNDIGLPGSKSDNPAVPPAGAMTRAEADALLEQIPACDLLLATPLMLASLTGRIEAGQPVLLLDRAPTTAPDELAGQVLQIAYDVEPAAFLLGLAVGASTNTQQVAAFADDSDPDADTMLGALNAGLRYRMNGAWLLNTKLSPDADGVVTPEQFADARERIRVPGVNLSANHYIVACGRTTPSIMYALTLPPLRATVLGAWGDFRQIRPAKVLACGVKDPAPALRKLLSDVTSMDDLRAKFDDGAYFSSFAEGGTRVTDFALLGQYDVAAEDVAETVQQAEAEFRAGELDIAELVEKYRR